MTSMNLPESGMKPDARSRGGAQFIEFIKQRFRDSGVSFDVILQDGSEYHIGTGSSRFKLEISHPKGLKAITSFDEGIIANAYINGWIDLKGDMLAIYDLRHHMQDRHFFKSLWRFIAPLLLGQIAVNKSAIRQHYERDSSFFLAFLDREFRCYTQGIFESEDEQLTVAVRRKMDFILERCKLTPGSEVLEIGPGWGSFAEYAARKGINVTGITIAEQSFNYMQQLTAEKNLPITNVMSDILEFKSEKQFDAIVLLGVMEHLPDYTRILNCFNNLLRPGGHVVFDAGAFTKKHRKSSFITEHIYPGNHSFFVLHEFLQSMASMPFDLKGVWDDRNSYYLTLVQWAQRFDANRDFIVEKFGEADYRSFRIYLWGSAHCFLRNWLQCYRLVLQKDPE